MKPPPSIKELLDRVEKRFNTPPTKHGKFLPLVQRNEAQTLLEALRLAVIKDELGQ